MIYVSNPSSNKSLFSFPFFIDFIDFAASIFTSSSLEGSAVAIPPIGTASCFRQIATNLLNIFDMNSVFAVTSNLSGQTNLYHALHILVLAFRSHLAAFSLQHILLTQSISSIEIPLVRIQLR